MANDIINKQIEALFNPQELELIKNFSRLENKVKEIKDAKNKALIELFEANGIKSFENDEMKITYTSAHETSKVDTQKMKDDLIYNDYVKKSMVSASIRITFKEKE